MKKAICITLTIITLFLCLTACNVEQSATTPQPTVVPEPTPELTPEPTPAPTPAPTPESEEVEIDYEQYSLAVCMRAMNHPINRLVTVGFIERAEELGYNTPAIIGTEDDDKEEQFAAAEEWAETVEYGKGGMLLWNDDHTSDELCAKLWNEKGIYIGIPNVKIMNEDGSLPDGVQFEMGGNVDYYGREAAKLAAQALDGKTGSFVLSQGADNDKENAITKAFLDEWEIQKWSYKLDDIDIMPLHLEGSASSIEEIDAVSEIKFSIIEENPDIIGAFGTTNISAHTWSDAAKWAGKRIWVGGLAATDTNLYYLENWYIDVIVAEPYFQEGVKTMEYFDILFKGGSVAEWTELDAGIVTRESTGKNSIEKWKGYVEIVVEY